MSRPRIASSQARGRARQQTRVREAAEAAALLSDASVGAAVPVPEEPTDAAPAARKKGDRKAELTLPTATRPPTTAAPTPARLRRSSSPASSTVATPPGIAVAGSPEAVNQCAGGTVLGQRERNREANRSEILEAARKAFLKLGYDALTIRDVVRRTGLAAGTFYNYFTDKDVLFKAVMEARIGEVTHAMHDARMRATSVAGFIHAAYHALFAQIAGDPSFFQLILRNEHAVRSLFEDTVNGFPMRELQDDIREFIRRGVFPEIDVELLAAAFYGVGFEMGRHLATRPQADAAATACFATRLLTAGISGFGLGTVPLPPRAAAPDEFPAPG